MTFFSSLALWLLLSLSLAFAEEPYFKRDKLNPGLSGAPAFVDRSTPRQTIETLYRLADVGDWDNAAHLLDLTDLAPALQAQFGADLAEKLKTVLDRKVVIDWESLVDRPDGFNATQTDRAATAGMARKSLRLWELSADKVPTSIRLERVKVGDTDPVWVFARQTVEDIAPLYDAFGPSGFEKRLPAWVTAEGAWGLMRWEFIGLPLLVLLSAAAGWLVYRAAHRFESATKSTVTARIVNATAVPLVIATVTTVLWWGVTTIFVFSGKLDAVLSPLLAIGFVTATLMLILNVFEAVLDRVVGFEDIDLSHRQGARQRATATRLAAVRRILAVVVFLIGAGIVLSTANWFPSLGYSLLASAGAVTLVVGFAARRILGNMLASL